MKAVALNTRIMEQRQRKGDKEDTLSAAAGTGAHFSKVPVGPVILMSLLPGLVTVHELVESFSTNNESDYEHEILKKVLKSMRKVSNVVRRTRSTTSLK